MTELRRSTDLRTVVADVGDLVLAREAEAGASKRTVKPRVQFATRVGQNTVCFCHCTQFVDNESALQGND